MIVPVRSTGQGFVSGVQVEANTRLLLQNQRMHRALESNRITSGVRSPVAIDRETHQVGFPACGTH